MIPYFEVDPLQLGPVTIHPFGVTAALAMIFGLWYARRVAEREHGWGTTLMDMAPWFLVTGLLFAHLVSLVFYFPDRIRDEEFWTFVNITSGLSSFGGLFGGALGAYIFIRRHALPVLPWLDILCRGFALGYVFGRAGCSIAHDHPGLPTDFILAMPYPARDGFPAGLRHDVGFYEFLFWVVLFVVFVFLGRRRRPDGFYAALFIVAYTPVRFGLDFLRVNDPTYAGLTFAQWSCLLTLPVGLWLLSWVRTHNRAAVGREPTSR